MRQDNINRVYISIAFLPKHIWKQFLSPDVPPADTYLPLRSQIQMFPNSLKLSSHPGNALGLSSTETVNAPRHHPGHLCLVETGDKAEPSNGKSQSQEPCQLLGSRRGGKRDTAPCSNLCSQLCRVKHCSNSGSLCPPGPQCYKEDGLGERLLCFTA